MAVRQRKDFKPAATSYKFALVEAAPVAADGEELYPVTLSDGSVDRHGDTVDPEGWDLGGFKSNPVLLWAHDSSALPIGTVKNVRVEAGKLRGEMKFADHAFAKDVKALVDAKILRTVSVGFKPIEAKIAEERDDGESWFPPVDFKRQELLELSVVPVPANPNATIDGKSVVDRDLVRAWALKTLEAFPAAVAIARAAPPAPAPADPVVEVKAPPERTPEQIAALVRAAVSAAFAAERMHSTGRLD